MTSIDFLRKQLYDDFRKFTNDVNISISTKRYPDSNVYSAVIVDEADE